MKQLKTRFLALCGLVILTAASLAPVVVEAQCPCVTVECSSGKIYCCPGTPQGTSCVYDRDCLNGGRCGRSEVFGTEAGPVD